MATADNYAIELGERVIASMYEENFGNKYTRQHRIAERALEAKLAATEKPFELCPFKNHNGWCKLEVGHKRSHTVVWLGNDDEEEDEHQTYTTGKSFPPHLWPAYFGIPKHNPGRQV